MNGSPPKARSGIGRLIFFGLSLLVFVALLALGTWQVQRLHWKQALINSIHDRIGTAPQALGKMEQHLAEAGDVDYWPTEAQGMFEHDHEQHFFATHKGYTGYYVYTPLRLADGRVLFVNRGFAPFDRKEASLRQQGQIAGDVTITGLARNRLSKKPSWIVPDNDLTKNIYYWKDLTAMAGQAGYEMNDVLPFFIDADETQNPGGLPIGGVTLIDLSNNHLQYAITWYGLAAALAGVFGFWLWRQRENDRRDDSA